MNLLSKLPGGLTRALGKLWLKTKGASPEICVVGGIVCGGAALVMVGIKTWKGKNTLSADVDAIRAQTHKVVVIDEEKTEESAKPSTNQLVKIDRKDMTDEQKKLLMARRIDFAKDILKIYWVPGLLAISSVGMIWGGRTILRKELSTATAAYAALLETYNKYRKRVAGVIGEEKERELAAGYSMEKHVDEKTGEVTEVPVINSNENLSQYAFWFNEGYFDKEKGEWAWRNFNHNRDRWQNRMTVKQLEDRFTRDLRCIGYVFLEDVALEFGVNPEEAKKFHDIGWVWKDGAENRVDFGVLDGPTQIPVNKGFMSEGHSQNEALINPNVDGYIGYVRDDYRKYDKRYWIGDLKTPSMKRMINKIMTRYDKEEMEKRVMRGY